MRIRGLVPALALLAAGCPKKPPPPPPPPRLVEARVVDRTPPGEAPPIDAAALSARAVRALAPVLPAALGAPENPGDYRLRLQVRQEGAETDEKGVMRALVEVRLARAGAGPGEPPIATSALAERVYQRAETPDKAAAWRAHVEHAVDDVLKGALALAKLHLGGPPELAAALGDADLDLRVEAIRVAAERKDAASVPRLIELLKSDDPRTSDRALGALVEIGDRRAVRPISDAARFRDLAQLPKVIDAMAALGGDEARAYLEFVATGHDDPEVRGLAQEALGRLDRRTLTGAPEGR